MLKAKNEKGKNIVPSENATILGLIVSKNLTWRDHLEVGINAMIPKLEKNWGP